MKRSSASITLVLIGSAVTLVACDRPYRSSSGPVDGSSDTVTTGSRSLGGYHRPYFWGTGAWAGPRSSRWSGSDSRPAGFSSTTRGGFGSSSRGFFGG